jgi:hypothetical protein
MDKALPTITESADELRHRFRSEKDGQKRQRLPALPLLASGQAPARLEIAELLAVHRHTVRAWLTAYERGGLPALLTIQKAPGKRRALSPAVRAQLQTRLEQPRGLGVTVRFSTTWRAPTTSSLPTAPSMGSSATSSRPNPSRHAARIRKKLYRCRPVSPDALDSAPNVRLYGPTTGVPALSGVGARGEPLWAPTHRAASDYRPWGPSRHLCCVSL